MLFGNGLNSIKFYKERKTQPSFMFPHGNEIYPNHIPELNETEQQIMDDKPPMREIVNATSGDCYVNRRGNGNECGQPPFP